MSGHNPGPAPDEHPFVRGPHATLLALAFPVLISLVAEPLTGLVDTAFVARLGAVPLAALGAGTTVLSSLFWIFNFLQIGTQTEIARSFGGQDQRRAAEISGLALVVSAGLGLLLIVLIVPISGRLASAMGADGELHAAAADYIRLRAFGAPAVLVTVAAFGALRGLQLMRIPLYIAVAINLLNVVLDAALIFGVGPIPALGVAGAALASVISQWIGAIWAAVAVLGRLGLPQQLHARDAGRLFVVGGDLFMRSGLLTGFMILTTRVATQIGAEAGAVHQAIRQLWLFTALFLDAFAVTGQSLVGYFLGAGRLELARRVARAVCLWSLAVGLVLALAMLVGRQAIEALLVPTGARGMFTAAWVIAALLQPVNGLAFATDGVHWGTGDYRFLRNAMLVSTGSAGLLILLLDPGASGALTYIWLVTGLWTSIRAGLGIARIWPGVWNAPLALRLRQGT